MSTITTYPLNGIDYDASDVAAYESTRTSGVYSADEDFAVTAAGGLNVTVSAGRAWVHPSRFEGYSITKREPETVTLPLADGSRPRIDRILLRYDAAAKKTSLLVLTGDPASTPTAPAITRNSSVYDLCLAEISRPAGSTSVTTGQITDTRLDESLCGVMSDGVTGLPTEQLLAEARARIAEVEETASNSAAAADRSQKATAQNQADAEAARDAAAGSARAASASETNAGQSAEKAAVSEGNAKESETRSKASEEAAKQSETSSATSEKNAATSEANALKYSQEAGAKAGTDKTLSVEDAPADAKQVGDELAGKLSLTGGTMTAPLILPGGLTALGYADNAGNRNAMPPRDRSLGTPTSEHFEMIASGKYNELFLGDYWTVDGVNYLIADFNYWHNCGDTACTKNHVLVVPRNNMYTASMNSTNVTTGGYVGSAMYKTGLAQAKSAFNAAFGSAHILNHREYLVNAVTNGKPTGTDWYDSTVELMNENMVYGGRQFIPMPDGNSDPWNTCRNYTIDKSQLSLFRYEPWLICNRNWYWLRDVVSVAHFANVGSSGDASCSLAGAAYGVRPVAGIC